MSEKSNVLYFPESFLHTPEVKEETSHASVIELDEWSRYPASTAHPFHQPGVHPSMEEVPIEDASVFREFERIVLDPVRLGVDDEPCSSRLPPRWRAHQSHQAEELYVQLGEALDAYRRAFA